DFDLGPCSTTNPSGIMLPVVVRVCAITEQIPINYLDHDSNPQSVTINNLLGIKAERRLVTVATAESVLGCIVSEDCCSGSGNNDFCEGCTLECIACAAITCSWGFEDPETMAPVTVTRLKHSDSGNTCLYVSDDLSWVLYFDMDLNAWILEKPSSD